MDLANNERLIANISWGYTQINVSTQDGKIISLSFRPPTPKEQAKAAAVYSMEFERASILKLFSENEMISQLIFLGRWSLEQENEIEGLKKDIHIIRRGLLDFVFNTTKLEHARSLLRRAEKVLIDRFTTRRNLVQNSSESHAEICQQRYLIGQITEYEDGEQFWPTQKDFDEYLDGSLISQLCEHYFHRSRIPPNVIRRLARSPEWRPYWEIAKNTNDLFNGPTVSWSLNQRELAYWSSIYDSVQGAYERPSKQIIEDDDLLDSWFIRQGEKLESSSRTQSNNKSAKPGKNESFIIADEDGAKRVYAMNDPGVRAQLQARQKLLKDKGSIQEQNMPDSQLVMRRQLMEKQKQHVKNIGSR